MREPNIRQDLESDDDFKIPHPHQMWDGEDRLGFVRKVYGILSAQLSITVFYCVIVCVSTTLKAFMLTHTWLFWVFLGISILTLIILCCVKNVANKVPQNYICMLIFTMAESYIIGFCCCRYSPTTVLIAASMTAMLVLGLTAYACLTKTDFTTIRGIMFVFLIALIIFGIFAIFFHSRILIVIYCTLGIIIFGIYMIIDTQMILGGKHHQFELDDYIMAAMCLYLDILNLFLFILQLLGSDH